MPVLLARGQSPSAPAYSRQPQLGVVVLLHCGAAWSATKPCIVSPSLRFTTRAGNTVGLPIFRTHHRIVFCEVQGRDQKPVLVPLLLRLCSSSCAHDIGLVNLDRTVERSTTLSRPSLADAVQHEPRGRHATRRCPDAASNWKQTSARLVIDKDRWSIAHLRSGTLERADGGPPVLIPLKSRTGNPCVQ